MTDFIIRDMAFGGLLGEPFSSSPFKWHGTADECRTQLAHGLEYKPGSIVLQMVYAIEDTSEGEGSNASIGDISYDEQSDKVTRHTVRSKSAADLTNDATEWVRNRKAGYKNAVLAAKGYPQGSEIDGVGFVLDAILAEMAARGPAVTQEFRDLLQSIAAVKLAYPKQ